MMGSPLANVPFIGRDDAPEAIGLGVLDNDDRVPAVHHLAVQEVSDGSQVTTDRAVLARVRTAGNESRPLDAVTVVHHENYVTGLTVKCQAEGAG